MHARIGHRIAVIALVSWLGTACSLCGVARAQGDVEDGDVEGRQVPREDLVMPELAAGTEPVDGPHETPMAGKPYQTDLLGREVDVEARDRSSTMAVALGGAFWISSIGGTTAVPMATFYYRGLEPDHRIRAEVSGLVNDVEYAQRIAQPLELVARLEMDHRRVFGDKEILDDVQLDDTKLVWGGDSLLLGPGFVLPLKPFNVDNDLRLQLLYRVGHLYFSRTGDTAPDLSVPADTIEHGPWLRLRLDTIQRNLLELPHNGVALGADTSLTFRQAWRSFAPGAGERDPFEQDTEPRYWKSSGYAIVAGGVPYLSERHRLELQLNGAWAPERSLDRYSAFRLGGGPLPKESSDLSRESYPGALFDQLIAQNYAMASVEYRVELLFFLYLHLRGTFFHGEIASLDEGGEATDAVHYRDRNGQVFTTAVTTGFPWDSSLYVEYDYDTGLVRGGTPGHSMLLLWSKDL